MKQALVVIDVQESFRARPEWSAMANPDIAEPVNRLVEHARANGALTSARDGCFQGEAARERMS